jgi:threonine dehydrogenase-like Zn-dependent dehydrogenase
MVAVPKTLPTTQRTIQRAAIVLHAEEQPLRGAARPGTHELYRNPRVTCEQRALGPLQPNFVRVKMKYVGICGTDLHLAEADPNTGYVRTSSPASIPAKGRILGHEGIGQIAQAGRNVPHLREGAWVIFDSIIACRHCDRCKRGFLNQCRHARLLGLEEDGLFAASADLPADIVHDVSTYIESDADARALALLEPAAVAFVACRKAKVKRGERLTIFGAGPIGTYCAMLARNVFGAGEIAVVEPVEFRRRFAARWAKHVFTPAEFALSQCDSFDVAFEASGVLDNVDSVLPRMNAAGRIVVLGRSGEPLHLSATDDLITNAISIMGSRGHHGGAYEKLQQLYAEKKFSPADAVTSVIHGLEKLAELVRSPDYVVQHDNKILVQL